MEATEVSRDHQQQSILRSSTHFNPVLLALALRDWRQQPFLLSRFVDPDRYFVTTRPHRGKTLRVLERPGLWNGSMAHWNTVFVEVPKEVFTPVKTVFDLLLEEHQGRVEPT